MASGISEFLIFLLIIIVIKESLAEAEEEVLLHLHPLTLESSGDNVTISWSGLASPSLYDWLGFYAPPESAHDHYLGYLLLSSCATWATGACSLTLPLVNMRVPYQFRLFRGKEIHVTRHTKVDDMGSPLPSTDLLLASSPHLTFNSFDEPTQVHLSLTSAQVGQMRVMFVTASAIDAFVKYGMRRRSLDRVAKTEHVTYGMPHMCGMPANSSQGWRDPGHIHSAVMEGLKGGTRYFYQVGSDVGGWSDIYSYVPPQAHADDTHALIFGDMGTNAPYSTHHRWAAESVKTCTWLAREMVALGDKPVLVAHIGDISYARGYAWVWDEFFHRIQPIAAQAPYHVCVGNHEYDWPEQPWKPDWAAHIYGKDSGGECGVPYSLRFLMPGNSSASTGTAAPATRNLFFSHSLGVVHFLYISTETDFLPGSEQLAFIAADLAGVDREETPFIVMLGHRPMYTSDFPSDEKMLREKMVEHIEPLMIKYGVSLALWGHIHKYERTCALQQSACVSAVEGDAHVDAPVHMVVGTAGQDWQSRWRPMLDHMDLPIYPQPEWSMFRSGEFGYARLHATRQVLTVSYVGNHDGEVHDVVRVFSGKAPRTSSNRVVESWLAGCVVGFSVLLALVALVRYTKNKQNASNGVPYAAVTTNDL